MELRKNNSDNYESIKVQLPINGIAFANRVKSLISSGMGEEEAKEFAKEPIELELYYDSDCGLFGVEAEAVSETTIYNPYTSKELLESDDDDDKNSIIKKINDIISEYGSFTIAEVEAESSPYLDVKGKLSHLAEEFRNGYCTIFVYDPTSHSSDEIDGYYEFYESFNMSQLEYILELAEKWVEINE